MKLILYIVIFFYCRGVEAQAQEKKDTVVEDVTSHVIVNTTAPKFNDYHYSSMNKPNPFIPPTINSLLKSEILPVESELQKFPLSEFKIVGIWSLRNTEMRAMMLTPTGQGIVAENGNKIGRRGGKIVEIDEKSVLVREYSLNSEGERQYEETRLWIEDVQDKPEDHILIQSMRAGRPNNFGYGQKNYYNSPHYEERRKDVLENMKNQIEEIDVEESRPNFGTDSEKENKPKSSATDDKFQRALKAGITPRGTTAPKSEVKDSQMKDFSE